MYVRGVTKGGTLSRPCDPNQGGPDVNRTLPGCQRGLCVRCEGEGGVITYSFAKKRGYRSLSLLYVVLTGIIVFDHCCCCTAAVVVVVKVFDHPG